MVREGIDELSALTYDKVELRRLLFGKITRPRKLRKKLLREVGMELPEEIPMIKANVDTKNKINKET